MDSRKKVSISMLAIGGLFVIYGLYRMVFAAKFAGADDQIGMYVLSVGAVLAIFGTGSIVGEKTSD